MHRYNTVFISIFCISVATGWLVGWGLTALLTQNRSYRACRFV